MFILIAFIIAGIACCYAEVGPERNVSGVDPAENALVRKFIVIESEGGLGSRISSLISCAYLAYLMDRVLVIDWKVSEDHP